MTSILANITPSVLRNKMKADGENPESTQKAQQSDHDADWDHMDAETDDDDSIKHQDATQHPQDGQEDNSHNQKHYTTHQGQNNIDVGKPQEENQLQQTDRASQGTSSAAISSVTTSPPRTNPTTTPSTTSSSARIPSNPTTVSSAMNSSDGTTPTTASCLTTSSGRSASVDNQRLARGATHQSSSQRHHDQGYNEARGEQVVYVNGVRTRIRYNGIPYTKEGLGLIEHFLTKMEKDYVKKLDYESLEREHKNLKSEYEKLKYRYKKDQKSLTNLQECALFLVDRYQPLPDSEIEKELREIGRSVADLSSDLVSNAALEVLRESLSGQTLSEDMHIKVWDTMPKWNSRLVVESVIWKELYERLLQNPFSPFEYSDVYMSSWNGLFGKGPQVINDYPPPSELSEQWRVITFNALNELSQRSTQPTAEAVRGTVDILATKLAPIGFQMEQNLPELLAIISSAEQLAKTLSTQKARLRLFLPRIGERFSKKNVYSHKLDPANKYGEDIESGEVLFVVAPGLRKWGDGNGRCLEIFNDIIPSKVLIDGPVE